MENGHDAQQRLLSHDGHDSEAGLAHAKLHAVVADVGDSGPWLDHSAKHVMESHVETAVYPQRWWVLILYSSIAFLQSTQWGIPGPISAAYESTYGFSSSQVQLLINYGAIFYIPFSFPFALWMDAHYGIRHTTRLGLACVILAACLRMIAYDSSPLSVSLVHVSYIINAIIGPIAMGGVSKVSETWFPPNERTTATALMSEANAISFSQVLAPFIVTTSDTSHMALLNYVLVAITAPFFIGSLLYFPDAPPKPPSVSAAHQAEHQKHFSFSVFLSGLRRLSGNRNFWVIAVCYGITAGAYGSWSTVLSIDLGSLSLSPQMVGLMGFVGNFVGNVAGVIAGRIADSRRNHRALSIGLMTAGSVAFALFALVAMPDVLPPDIATGTPATVSLFVLSALGGLCVFGCIPLFFEMCVETSYPAPEASVIMMLTLMNNLGGLVFLSIPTSSAGTAWMNWFMTGVCAAAATAMAVLSVHAQTRTCVDDGTAVETEDGTVLTREAKSDKNEGLAVN